VKKEHPPEFKSIIIFCLDTKNNNMAGRAEAC